MNTGKEEASIQLTIGVCSALILTSGFTLSYTLVKATGTVETILASTYTNSITNDCDLTIFELVDSLVTNPAGKVSSYAANANLDWLISSDGDLSLTMA